MPFRSERQRRYLWANEPEVAERWTNEHRKKAVKKRLKKRRKKHEK